MVETFLVEVLGKEITIDQATECIALTRKENARQVASGKYRIDPETGAVVGIMETVYDEVATGKYIYRVKAGYKLDADTGKLHQLSV